MNLRMRTIQSVFVGLAFGWVLNVAAQTDTAGNVELRPGNVTASEQQTVAATLARQFGVKPGAELQIRAAGPYRFAGTEDFFLIQRQDLGSMAFETRAYGTSAPGPGTEAGKPGSSSAASGRSAAPGRI